MRCFLLVVDLEGVAGVDEVADLVAGSRGYRRAQRLLTNEVKIVTAALLEAGWDRVRISDSHISGSGDTNLILSELPAGVELRLEDDPYAESILEGVDAVAALGMHAPAGSDGFAAHTVNLHSRWSMGGRLLSETDLLMGLVAERGLPFCFASGDEVLASHSSSAAPFLITKHRREGRFVSRSIEEVHEALRALAARSDRAVRGAVGPGPIELRFKSHWQAEQAAATGEGERVGPLDFELRGGDFRSRYRRAWTLTERAAEGLGEAVRGELGSHLFVEDVAALLARGFETPAISIEPAEVERSRDAFLALTEATHSEARALRALILHMCAHHAPRVFRALGLAPLLEQSLSLLSRVPAQLDESLDADELQARVDARYLEHARGLEGPKLDPRELDRVLTALAGRGDALYAFILGSMAAAMGVPVAGRHLAPPRPEERVLELYVQTHELLFESAYLARAFASDGPFARRERLLLAAPFVIQAGHVDLGAEVALLLQSLGEGGSREHAELLAFVRAETSADGRVFDGSLGVPAAELADHATGVAFLVLAGALERFGVNS